jgi:hypothetical protein
VSRYPNRSASKGSKIQHPAFLSFPRRSGSGEPASQRQSLPVTVKAGKGSTRQYEASRSCKPCPAQRRQGISLAGGTRPFLEPCVL